MKSYLVNAYAASTDSLYSRMLFQSLASLIQTHQIKTPKVLDLGCADARGHRLLNTYLTNKFQYGDFQYFGVDIDENFKPDLVADIRDVKQIFAKITFKPNVILLNDVLEHFDNGKEDIEKFLSEIIQYTPKDTLIYITVPQIYRLDCFKLPHLHYIEHRVRFNSIEWASIVGKDLQIKKARAASFLTGLPHLLMASRHYTESNTLGQAFKYVRSKMNRSKLLEKLDSKWVNRWGENPLMFPIGNGLIFECVRR